MNIATDGLYRNLKSPYLRFWLAFVAILALLMVWFGPEFPGKPIYHRMGKEGGLIPLENGVPFAGEFEAGRNNIEALCLRHAFADKQAEVRLLVENRTRGTTLVDQTIGYGLTHWAEFPRKGNDAGDRIRVTYEVVFSRKDRWPDMAQGLRLAEPDTSPEHGLHSDAYELRIFVDGEEVEDAEALGHPMFVVRWGQMFRWLRWSWPVVLGDFSWFFCEKAGFGIRCGICWRWW